MKPIHIRRANLTADRRQLIEFYRRNLTPHSDDRRFEWLYCACPHGDAHAWLAYTDDQVVVGGAGAFPRKFYVDGHETAGFVLGDFCVDFEHRSLGPSLQLQRACLAGIRVAPYEFFYDFPSNKMMAVYRRLNLSSGSNIVRWAKPLRSERRIERAIGSNSISRSLSAVANAVLTRRGWRGNRESCETALHQGNCTEEFTTFDQSLRARKGVNTVRSAEYLNWRFLSHPIAEHAIITARQNAWLVGYIVLSFGAEAASIVDLNCVEDPSVVARLLAAAIAHLRSLGAWTISLSAIEAHPWNAIFERAGFRRREEAPMIFNMFAGNGTRDSAFHHRWFLMSGERDS